MGFAGIIGHVKGLEMLRAALRKARLHHAYLFLGPEGVGKRTIALSLAKAIHCAEGKDDFCDSCVDCGRIGAGNHPDVRVIEPLAGKKEISIQQIREAERALTFRSFTGKKKIAILDPATLLNLSAQNALLKTLEEPPPDSLLILIAPNDGGLLPTLRSRCLRLLFGPLPRHSVAKFLVAREGMKAGEAEFLAALAIGSLGAVVKLDQKVWLENRQCWIEGVSSLSSGDYRAAVLAAEALSKSPEDTLAFLRWAESWYRDLLVHAVRQDSEDIINRDLLIQIEQRSAATALTRLISAMDRTVAASARVRRNLNRRMILEKLFFDVVGER